MATGFLAHPTMRRVTIGVTLMTLWAVPIGAQAPKPRANAQLCANTTTQTELTACFTREARAADSAVRRAYKQVFAQTTAARRAPLRASQRAWVTYRDEYCRFDAAQYEGGSAYASELGACLAEISAARTEELLSDASAERETGGSAPEH